MHIILLKERLIRIFKICSKIINQSKLHSNHTDANLPRFAVDEEET